MFIHIVGPGDSLFSIGRRYGASVDQIRGVNGLDETNIVPGQALLILFMYIQSSREIRLPPLQLKRLCH